jgi:hypothetical protein
LILLHLEGQGRKRLELQIRMHLERRGGWRVASGQLPAAPATALTLTVPAARTEVRLPNIVDRSEYETAADNEQIATALGAEGALELQWRPKVAEGQVDRSLTASSEAVLDVQEDGLRLIWRLNLEFPRSRRDTFTVLLPDGYLLEKVLGDNVRTWEVKAADNVQRLDVTLLKEAVDRETVTLRLSRRGVLAADQPAQFPAPAVSAEGAVLHKGRLTVRRSPLLELRTAQASGLSRTDIPADALQALASGDIAQESPLGLQPYQAFEFSTIAFNLALSAAPVASDATATVQSMLRIAERESTLETQATIQVRSRPVHRVLMAVPKTLEIDQVSVPGEFTWAVTDEAERRLVSVYLSAGQSQPFAVVIRGSLGRRQAQDPVPVPKLEVLDVVRQQGDIAVQIDPAFDVRAVGLQHCETILLSQVFGWLNPEQRPLARLALRYERPQYAGRLEIASRSARVSGYTVTNVKVTDIAVEETIILDLTIRDAGIRELAFVLPAWLETARINAPMLRQKTIEDAGTGLKRFRLELQDDVTGQYRILIENDRALLTGKEGESEVQTAPIPVLETGRTDQRFVTLENASRDEVVAVDQVELSPLNRQQAEWRKLAAILGENLTTAYIVPAEAKSPRLTFQTKQRKTVETAGASIGLGETVLVVDAHGAYRGQQTYHVNNTIEQFLEIQLPPGAQLWTATVAVQPVKPTEVPGGTSPDQLRIPLIKTAEGDLDYPVVLKYGGHLGRVKWWDQVAFPLMRTVNINVELSRVRLRLPETHQWGYFDGSMRRVLDAGEYEAQFFRYFTEQSKRLVQAWNTDNPYAKVRAYSNLKQLETTVQSYKQQHGDYASNEALREQLDTNTVVVQQAQQQAEAYEAAQGQVAAGDNRRRLNTYWMDQKNDLARNVVTDGTSNFGVVVTPEQAQPQSRKAAFNYDWLAKNKMLEGREKYSQKEVEERFGKQDQERVGGKDRYFAKGQSLLAPQQQALNAPVAGVAVQPPVDQSGLGAMPGAGAPQRGFGGMVGGGMGMPGGGAGGRAAGTLSRSQRELARDYQKQLEDNVTQQAVPALTAQTAEPAGAMYGVPGLGLAPGGQPGPANGTLGYADGGGQAVVRGEGIVPGSGMPQAGGEVGQQVDLYAVETHLASLDVDLPQRGREYLFTTVRGDIRITAHAVSEPLLDGLIRLGWILAGFVAIVIGLVVLRLAAPVVTRTRWCAVLVLLVGLFSLVTGIFPVLGLLALGFGVFQLIRLTLARRRQRAAVAA